MGEGGNRLKRQETAENEIGGAPFVLLDAVRRTTSVSCHFKIEQIRF